MCREIVLYCLTFVSTEFSNGDSTCPLWWQSYADKSQKWASNNIDAEVVMQTAHTFQNMEQSPICIKAYWLPIQWYFPGQLSAEQTSENKRQTEGIVFILKN